MKETVEPTIVHTVLAVASIVNVTALPDAPPQAAEGDRDVAGLARQGRRRGCAARRAARAGAILDDDHVELAFVGRVDQLDVVAVVAPLLSQRSRRCFRIEFHTY